MSSQQTLTTSATQNLSHTRFLPKKVITYTTSLIYVCVPLLEHKGGKSTGICFVQ